MHSSKPTSSFRRQFWPVAASDEDNTFIHTESSFDGEPAVSPQYNEKPLSFTWKLTIFFALLSPALLLSLVFNTYSSWTFNHIHDDDAYTRKVFGDIPFTARPFGTTAKPFEDSDPYDGQASALYRGKPFNASSRRTAWDDIYPSDHLAIETPEHYGLWSGVDLKVEGKYKGEWTGEMGFTIGMLHQLHCVGILKHAMVTYNKTDEKARLTEFEIYHANHCVELLREVRSSISNSF
ncbi:hypothetical protein OIDMADRAFT_59333 [Oidiodendron maius Zn]|uniref:Uncharacterized protein n=1 Tax=Oidiodendron maius (strain Zn) TaxID=913774 RepID=A0A0C3GZ60_OIDMZ|nr:hypothetical protein OIDMADRAFT_59333 [Oidiodendron maius Zn]